MGRKGSLMENATKAILIAASVIITMAIVTLGLIVLKAGQNTAANSVSSINEMNRIAENEYLMYDNTEVSGNEVVSAIDKVLSAGDAVGVLVTTKAGGANYTNWYVYNATVLNSLKSASHTIADAEDIEKPATFVNPAAKFTGRIYRDSNGRIAKLSFVQN